MKTLRKHLMTPEEQAKSEARKARFSALLKTVAEMSDEERAAMAARMPVMTTEGRTLSTHNQILLTLQRDNVTIVGGFQQWLKQGRCVSKGESGLMIWVPKTNAKDNETTTESANDTASPVYFFAGTVFDISQTCELTPKK